MEIQRVTMAAGGDVAGAVAPLRALASGAEGFRDGDDWFHVDLPGTALRLAVSSAAGGVQVPTLLLKVADVSAARDELVAAGLTVGTPETGRHEVRCAVPLPGVRAIEIVLYAPLPRPTSEPEVQ